MSKCKTCEKYLNVVNRIFDIANTEPDLYDDIVEAMKTKSVNIYRNPCHTCVYSDCDPDTCVYLYNCNSWEEFYNKDGSVKEDADCIFVDNGIYVVGKIEITDINEILKERNN